MFGAWNTLVSGKASNLKEFLISLIFTTARLHKSYIDWNLYLAGPRLKVNK